MNLTRELVLVGGGMLVATIVCLLVLKWDGKAPARASSSGALHPSDRYAECVQKVLLGSDQGAEKREVEVAASLKDFLQVGPKESRAKSWVHLQQYVHSDEQRQMIEHCAESAGIASPIRYVTIEVRPKRDAVTVLQLGAAATHCKTDASSTCLLPVLEPDATVRVSIQSSQYEATRLLKREEIGEKYAQIELKLREEKLLTVTASEDGHPFLGWIIVAPTFDNSAGELTSQECFRDSRWDPADCHEVRADENGRVEFRYTSKLSRLQVSLKDYRPAKKVWDGEPGSDRIDVSWLGVTGPGSSSKPGTVGTARRQLPCGSRVGVETVLARLTWPATREYRVSIGVDESGHLAPIDGFPEEVSATLKSRRIPVAANCLPASYAVRYLAKVD